MENSSGFGYQISGSSRGLNSSEVSNRNNRSIPSVGDKIETSQLNRVRTKFGYFREDGGAVIRHVDHKEISLRQWLDDRKRVVDALECLHIFIQIVEIVNLAHSQRIVLHNVRPSCFVMSSMNRVSFIESASCSDSDSEMDFKGSCSTSAQNRRNVPNTVSENTWLQSGLENLEASYVEQTKDKKQCFPMKRILEMETSWYTSPEEAAGAPSSCASDVYRLGALLFELYCTCSSTEEKTAVMSSLTHRVFPPQLLLKWPNEALFCLWLLHPEPASRPNITEVLQSEFLTKLRDSLDERVAAVDLKERIEEQELLLEFLLVMKQRKQEAADKLRSTVSVITSDLEEVMKLQSSVNNNIGIGDSPDDDSVSSGSRKRIKLITQSHNREVNPENEISKTPRLMKNFRKLESAYFLTRRRAFKPISKGSVVLNEKASVNDFSTRDRVASRQSRWISSFLDGLYKYLSFSKLKLKADFKQTDLLSSSNLVCSLGFDRDGEFFATAGVNKKIKVFEHDSILNGNRDIHYPVVEMTSKSKLSSVCWNSYIKGQIASSNFEGVVQVWDVTRSEMFTEMKEHERRVWSVDFSSADPTLLASGSDDGFVKLWNINQAILFDVKISKLISIRQFYYCITIVVKIYIQIHNNCSFYILLLLQRASVGSIKTKANVCCVQFPSGSGNSLAFGSADHRIYFYDLRNTVKPVCTFVGHEKTVSYVKFIDSMTLVSSSTDNTLKLWDLSECSSHVVDSPVQSFTGHTNLKNFVGLSVYDGYIATGSETNEVFVYHKAFPMPTLSYKFNTMDPLSGDEVDDTEQFVSSVCWRNNSSSLVAANSMGDIKLLEMI